MERRIQNFRLQQIDSFQTLARLCTQEDLDMLYQFRSQKKFDKTVLEEASWKDFDPQAIVAYRVYRKEVNAKAKELAWNDQELMIALRAAVEVKKVI